MNVCPKEALEGSGHSKVKGRGRSSLKYKHKTIHSYTIQLPRSGKRWQVFLITQEMKGDSCSKVHQKIKEMCYEKMLLKCIQSLGSALNV